MAQTEVVFEKRGRLGVVMLNRPRSINAITHSMVTAIRQQLDAWMPDRGIASVLIRGSGERGLCAGGDILSIYRSVLARDRESVLKFWRDEYALDHLISRYPKPVVAFMDGVVLGGGMGISAHASHRIVTEKSRMGFPETTIGFVPDVGATWLLSRVPGELGTYLGVTGASVGAGDGLAFGFADSFVPSQRLDHLAQDLESGEIDAAIAQHSGVAPEPVLAADATWVDDAFAGATITEIVCRLRASSADRSNAVAEDILSKSPLAVAATLESLRRSSDLPSLGAALEREFTVSANGLYGHDFTEGVRALLIDKDRSPSWLPATAAEITMSDVEAYFTSLTGEVGLHLS
jgi:enoyl-CoA hydratase